MIFTRKLFRKLLSIVVIGSFLISYTGIKLIPVLGEQLPSIVDASPIVMDCDTANNLFDANADAAANAWWNSSWPISGGGDLPYSFDTTVGHSNNTSLKYSEATASWNGLYAPDITVLPDTDYTFSFWVRGDVTGDAFGAIMARPGESRIADIAPIAFDSEWHQVGVTINTGSFATVCFYIMAAGGTIYFDDFQLFELSDGLVDPFVVNATPVSKNCDAADNLFGANADAAANAWWNSSWPISGGGDLPYSFDTTVGHSNNTSLKYSEATASWNGLYAPDITVLPNTEYTFTFWIRGDIAGDALGAIMARPGESRITDIAPIAFDSEWHQVGVTINTGRFTTVCFYIMAAGGTIYFDDFQLFELSDGLVDPFVVNATPVSKNCDAANNLFGANADAAANAWWNSSWPISGGGDLPYSFDTTVGHSNNTSLKYSEATASWNGLYAPDITVLPNTEYTFTFWIRGDVPGEALGAILARPGESRIADIAPIAFDSEWHQVGVTINTGRFTTVCFYIMAAGGTIYFDDFQLFKTSDALIDPFIVKENPIAKNCDAANNLFGANADAAANAWWNSSWPISGGGDLPYSFDTTVGHSNNTSLKYSEATASWNGLYAPDITVLPNTEYTFTFWIRGDVPGEALGAILARPGENRIADIAPLAFDSVWHQVGVTINTGRFTTVCFYIMAAGGTIYFDDFQLFKTSDALPSDADPSIISTSPVSKNCDAANNLFGANADAAANAWWNSSWPISGGGDLPYSFDTTVGHSNNTSLKYSEATASWNGLYAPDITVLADTDYTFSFWVRGDVSGDALGAILARPGESRIADIAPLAFDSAWHQVGVTINTGRFTTVCFYIMAAGGTIYFDDFQLFKTTDAFPSTEVEASIVSLNPTAIDCLDADNLFGDASGLETDNWWKTGWNWACGAYTRVNETKHGGEYSLRYSEPAANWDNVYFAPDMTVLPNTNYTLSVWVKGETQGDVFLCMLVGNDKIGGEIYLQPKTWSNSWHQIAYTFNTGKRTVIRLAIGSGGGTAYFDDFKLFVETRGIVPPEKTGIDPEGRRKVYHNVDCINENNLITDVGCTDETYWNTGAQGFGEPMSISTEKPYEGDTSLKFVANGQSYIKWFDVEADTDYYLSAMLSADPTVLGDIKYYMVDSEGTQIENNFTPEEAENYVLRGGVDTVINIPSWDGLWYNRTYMFNTGRETKVGIKIVGTKGTLFLDNLKFFKKTDMVLLQEIDQYALTLEINPDKAICSENDNLIENGNIEAGSSVWSDVIGFGKFVNIETIDSNKLLTFKGTNNNSYYMAWFDVEPDTEYTMSFYANVIEDGTATFGVFDGSQKKNILGLEQQMGSADSWKNYSVTFDSNNTDKVAFYIYDGTGEAAFDKIRLFSTTNGLTLNAQDAPATLSGEDTDTGSPDTGDSSLLVIIALFAASGGIVTYKLRRGKSQKTNLQ